MKGRVAVKFRRQTPGADIRNLRESVSGAQVKRLDEIGWRVIEVDDVDAAIARYKADPNVEVVERVGQVRPLYIPNDPEYGTRNTTNLSILNLPAAWDLTTGSSSVRVAIIDSGISASPEWDDRIRRDLGANTCNGEDPTNSYPNHPVSPYAISAHGDTVMNMLAATGDNGLLSCGVDWNCEVVPIRMFPDGSASGTNDDFAEAILHAVSVGCHVINASVGSVESEANMLLLFDAVQYAVDNGVMFVAPAGNGGSGQNVLYPASNRGVLCVGGCDATKALFNLTTRNYASDVSALGWAATFNDVEGGTDWLGGTWQGTSFSSPAVAGIASLLKAYRPTITPAEITARIIRSAHRTTWQLGDGWGVPDAYLALTMATPEVAPTAPSGLSVSQNGAMVTLGWAARAGAAGYRCYWGPTPDAHSIINTTTGTSLTFDATAYKAQYGDLLYYRVSAYSKSGEGEASAAVALAPSFDLASAFLAAPVGVVGSASSSSGAGGSVAQIAPVAGSARSTSSASGSASEATGAVITFDLASAFLPAAVSPASGSAGSNSGASGSVGEAASVVGGTGSGSGTTGSAREVASVGGAAGSTSNAGGSTRQAGALKPPFKLELTAADGFHFTLTSDDAGRLTLSEGD